MRSTIFGTGLIALDLVIGGDNYKQTRYYAGGTCGNVLTILSYLGWNSYPFARLNGDFTSNWVRDDLSRFGVQQDFLSLHPTHPVPVIIEWIRKDRKGIPHHRYSFVCPTCGSRKPSHRPITDRAVKGLLQTVATPSVFFFDRLSRAALTLAQEFGKKGALIVFEPSGVGDPKLFKQAMSLIHVLKYSTDRIGTSIGPYNRQGVLLEIETLGDKGLRYRSRIRSASANLWRSLPGHRVKCLKDAAGSGDWLTACLIHRLGASGLVGFRSVRQAALKDTLQFAQAAASWNCEYEAPRGGQYVVDSKLFLEQVHRILAGNQPPSQSPQLDERVSLISPDSACLRCHAENGDVVAATHAH
jgi:fructokinase